MRINLRAVEGVGVFDKLDMTDRIVAMAKQKFGPDYEITPTGLYYFYARLVASHPAGERVPEGRSKSQV